MFGLSFGLTAALMIFLHMAPMTAGAAWAVYKDNNPKRVLVMQHKLSKVEWLAYLRSQSQKIEFAKIIACPSTKKHIPSCPGYVIDHIKPLCDGGPDKASNMQWQMLAASYKKDVIERRVCACHKAGKTNCADPWAIKKFKK